MISFSNPKVQAAPNANTYVISGVGEEREISLPDLIQQLSAAGFDISQAGLKEGETGDIPKLVEVFDDVADKDEARQ